MAAAGPCAAVQTTTPITEVSSACRAVWLPYDVTEVPPADILSEEHVPAAPPVVNMTGGAVTDAQAQHWADANNWDTGWFAWAEANHQPRMLVHAVGPDVILTAERLAMDGGATIAQPICNLYPTAATLYPVGAEGHAYFRLKGLPSDDAYVLVETFTGPCNAEATYPDGHTAAIVEMTSSSNTVFVPGVLRHDPELGDIWYSDAGGSCADPAGPPREWCGR